MIGTLINIGAVIVGSVLGLLIHAKLPLRFIRIVFQGIGIFTIFLGIKMALKTGNLLIMVFSIVIGSVIGEFINIDKGINNLSDCLKRKIKIGSDKFSEGLITAFLLFCLGSMTILGAIEEGLGGRPNLLLTKSLMDGFSSIALSASLGIGVIFSVIPLLIYQGGLTVFAGFLQNFFNQVMINELTAVGGVLLIGLGINILEITKIKISNMLPSLIIVIILVLLFL
ncbi:MAG: DUF554 domain-containing protein [Candidatus Latescibacteria bacterium]|nr:DUF554 domain-containing protein [Candidatus Latescibacterota bacterium]